MMDSVNFTLNTAYRKIMKIPFDTTENKYAWEQFLTVAIPLAVPEPMRVFGNKKMRLIHYTAKLVSN